MLASELIDKLQRLVSIHLVSIHGDAEVLDEDDQPINDDIDPPVFIIA